MIAEVTEIEIPIPIGWPADADFWPGDRLFFAGCILEYLGVDAWRLLGIPGESS